MQKFKVTKEEIIQQLNIADQKFWIPDIVCLEGELLEGGTVEKKVGLEGLLCDVNECRCGTCHNKKEERCPVCLAIPCYCKFSNIQQSNDFNREIPKAHPCKKRPCVHDIVEEEVQLPEKLDYPLNEYMVDVRARETINSIITYLKAHE